MSKLPFRPTSGLVLAFVVTTAAAATGTVTVRYDHPENFTETKEVRAFAPMRADSAYLDTLKRYIETKAATELGQGQSLDIVVTDIDRAGSYAPSVGSLQPVRVVKDVYPPRITLHFRLLDSEGQVVREGDRTLTDLGFMYDSPGGSSSTDPLRYEKRTIDRWLARGPAKL
jgi:hypothetical protein